MGEVDLQSRRTKAGISKQSAHDFRRAFTKAALLKTDIVTTARLLRHQDTSQVMKYAHQNTEDLRKAHQQLSPADNLK